MSAWDVATGGLLSFALGDYNRARQREDAKRATREQINGAKELAENQKNLDYDMWKKTGPVGMMEQIKQAGMSPGVMMGKGGIGGGITGGGGGMPSMAPIPDANAATANQLNTMMGMASIKLMEAQANKANADAGLVPKQGANIDADTTNKNLQAEILKVQGELAGKSLHNQLSILNSEANRMMNEAAKSLYEANVSGETQFDRIEMVKQQLTNMAIEAVAKTQGIALDKARVNEITNGIAQKWKELNIQEDKTGYEHADRLKAIEEYTSNALKVAGIYAAGQVVGDVIQIATRRIPKGSVTTTTDGAGKVTRESWTRPN